MKYRIPMAGLAAALGLSLLSGAVASAQSTSRLTLSDSAAQATQVPTILQAPTTASDPFAPSALTPVPQYEEMSAPAAACTELRSCSCCGSKLRYVRRKASREKKMRLCVM